MGEVIEDRIKYIKENKYLIILILILFGSFLLRLDLFSINVNQSYWWDESTYLNTAKYWAFGEPDWNAEALRPPLFIALLALLFKIGLSETSIRFLLLLIPSLLLVFIVYLLGKELFNKEAGLIAAVVTGVAWNLLFNTSRVHTDIPYTLAIISTVYFFYKGYVKEENIKRNLIITGALFSIAYSIRETALTFVPAFLIYILLKEKRNILKQKKLLYIIIPAILFAIPYFTYGMINFNHPAPWLESRLRAVTEESADDPITSACFMMLQTNLEWVWFVFMILGLILTLRFIIIIDKVIKNIKDEEYKGEIFLAIFFLSTILFFTFANKTCAEPRWIMPIVILGALLIGYALNWIYNYFKPMNKYLALIFILIVLVIGAYTNIQHNNQVIQAKLPSFNQFVDTGKIIKETTNKDAIIATVTTQAEVQYSSNRKTLGWPGNNEKEVLEYFKEIKPEYIIVSFYVNPSPQEQWKLIYPYQHPNIFPIVKIYPPLVENKIPFVGLFKINYEELDKRLKEL
ncbi:glycosyltransferase family 39 protein [Candidatus Woesearchaeota archaeon]|nr:glycosyltransferase family 39 protein [Candidatus Woesearchaeota archaeon]